MALSQNKYRTQWPIFHRSVSLLFILKSSWCINIIFLDYESVLPEVWPQTKCRAQWPTFHGPVICLIIWDVLDVQASYLWIVSQYDHKVNVGQWYIHFTVQWLCLISWRVLDALTSYLLSMNQCEPRFDAK